jgi:DNA repair photolyase
MGDKNDGRDTMSIIYEPKGKAREYSPLAANFYDGCDHGCVYCYAPGIRRMTRERYASLVKPRRDILHELEKDARKYAYSQKQVLFNFMGDPYCKVNDTHKITRGALSIMLDNHIPVAILTKGGTRACQDIDIIKKYGEHIKVGATLTFITEGLSSEYEPGAASPLNRIDMLRTMKENNIKTWASFEPVLDIEESLALIDATIDCVDEYKIGKVNNYDGRDKHMDWTGFLEKAVKVLRHANKPFYIKHDLRVAAPTVKLYGNEVIADDFVVTPWERKELF